MVKSSPKSHPDYDSSSFRGEEGDGSGGLRSKHSQTEQRRRTRINHRFQMLRDLIPQNDLKRDKASFLLEVIQYIHFLHEKLQLYEGSFTRQPSKLVPWKNHQAPAESMVNHAQIMKNGSEMLTDVQNIMECDLDGSAVYKSLEQFSGSTNTIIPLNVPNQSNLFTVIGRGGMPAESFQESVADAENVAQPVQSQQWQVRQFAAGCAAPNTAEKRHEEATNETGTNHVSDPYSQGILNIVRESLELAGVDMSETSISVEIEVRKHGRGGANTC